MGCTKRCLLADRFIARPPISKRDSSAQTCAIAQLRLPLETHTYMSTQIHKGRFENILHMPRYNPGLWDHDMCRIRRCSIQRVRSLDSQSKRRFLRGASRHGSKSDVRHEIRIHNRRVRVSKEGFNDRTLTNLLEPLKSMLELLEFQHRSACATSHRILIVVGFWLYLDVSKISQWNEC